MVHGAEERQTAKLSRNEKAAGAMLFVLQFE